MRFFSILLLVSAFIASAIVKADQDPAFRVQLELNNPTSSINDGSVTITVDGGQAPYLYYWSIDRIDTNSRVGNRLTEGIVHNVTVLDAAGRSVKQSFEVESTSLAEIFNGTFKPIVDAFGSVIFWDPFNALNLYDNRIYDKSGAVVKNPN